MRRAGGASRVRLLPAADLPERHPIKVGKGAIDPRNRGKLCALAEQLQHPRAGRHQVRVAVKEVEIVPVVPKVSGNPVVAREGARRHKRRLGQRGVVALQQLVRLF